MSAAHQVADLAFHLGPGGPVVGPPSWIGLGAAGPDELGFVAADPDDATGLGVRALGGQRAPVAGRAEGRGPTAGLGRPDGDDDICGQVTVPASVSTAKRSLGKGRELNNIYITNDMNGVLLRAGARPEA